MQTIQPDVSREMNGTLGLITASGLTLIESGHPRIAGLSLTVRAGEIIGLAGGSEQEESTCLRLLAGHIRPTFGVLRLCGVPIHGTPPRFLLGTNLEAPPADRGLTGGQWLGRLAADAGYGAAEAAARADRILDGLALPGRAATQISALNAQERAMFSLGAAMVADAPVVIARQPLTGLDPWHATVVRSLLHRWRAASKAVLISADLGDLAEADCQRVYLIKNGQPMARTQVRNMHRYQSRIAGADSSIR
jgi:ABC-type multidrug transport system ATPase subunit